MTNKLPVFCIDGKEIPTFDTLKRRLPTVVELENVRRPIIDLNKPNVGDIIEFPSMDECNLYSHVVFRGETPDPRDTEYVFTMIVTNIYIKVIRNNRLDWFLIRTMREIEELKSKRAIWSISDHFVTSFDDKAFVEFLFGRKIRITGYDGTYYTYDIIG